MRRLDVYLTRKAEATWPGAAVWADYQEAKDPFPLRFRLEFPEEWRLEPIILSDRETPARSRFRVAREALGLLRKGVIR